MRKLTLFLSLLFMGLLTTNVSANVFASAVEVDYSGSFPATISYSLNQSATSVVITIKDYPAGNVVKTITGGTDQGFNDVGWDGSLDAGGTATSGIYTISIEASDDTGSSGFEMISYDTGPDSWYWSSSGVTANTRQTSPYFGMTYVTERTGGTSSNSGGGETIRGLYLHDSQGRYFGQQLASAYASGNSVIDWAVIGGNEEGSPWGITVGPDDRTYVFVLPSDRSGSKSGGLAIGDALFSTGSVETVLPFTGDAISDVIVVGLGAERMLYTVEQTSEKTGSDNDKADDGDGFDSAHIKMYALGESTGEYSAAGDIVIPTSTLSHPFRIEMDADGYLYVVQQAYASLALANTIYGLSKWDISGASPVEMWHVGLNDAPEHADSTANVDNARATNFNGLGLDEAGGHVYVSRKNSARPNHNVLSYSMSTGAFETSFVAAQSVVDTGTVDLPGGGGSSIRDVNVDAAGNVMVVNSSFEAFRLYSPPVGANSFNTYSPYAIDAGVGVVSTPVIITALEPVDALIPTKYSIAQNYPNPFNPSTIIEFSISQKEFVTLKIYDVSGREISTLVNDNLSVGNYKMSFDATGLAAGIYFYKITAGNFVSTKKMMLLK